MLTLKNIVLKQSLLIEKINASKKYYYDNVCIKSHYLINKVQNSKDSLLKNSFINTLLTKAIMSAKYVKQFTDISTIENTHTLVNLFFEDDSYVIEINSNFAEIYKTIKKIDNFCKDFYYELYDIRNNILCSYQRFTASLLINNLKTKSELLNHFTL